MLPAFLQTGRVIGSAFVMLSSRIVPYDFAYEIDAEQLVALSGTTNTLWLVAGNFAAPAATLVIMRPTAVDTLAGYTEGYEFYANGTRVAAVLWDEVQPYCVLPYGVPYSLIVNWNFLMEFRLNEDRYYPSMRRFTIEGMLGRNRELIIGTGCELRIGNTNLGFRVLLQINGSTVWDNYSQQIYLPVPLEQDKTPFKLTVFSYANNFKNESVFLLFGLRNDPIIILLKGTAVRLNPIFCRIDPLSGRELGECYIRMFGHIIPKPHEIVFSPPTNLPFDERRSSFWDATVSQVSSGTYRISWSKDGALINTLVFGTFNRIAFGQALLTHPVVEVSVTQTLEQTAIVQEASMRLMPRKYADWEFERWLFRPLYEFFVTVNGMTMFLGYRSRISLQSEPGNIIRGEISLMDNRALLQRMTIDKPVNYDYWRATEAARDFLQRFGLAFGTTIYTPDTVLFPELVHERAYTATWRPRLGETALDFLNRLAEVVGWRLDFTQLGSVIALPRWETYGKIWYLVWPDFSGAFLSELPVSRMNISVDDFQRRNILIVYGIDANTLADTLRIYADLESFVDWTSERFFPLAVPAFVKFDRPIPALFMDRFGAWLSERLFVVPAEIEFQTPLNFSVRPGDRLRILNPTEADLHKYELLVTSVRHEIGRDLTTFVRARVYKQIIF